MGEKKWDNKGDLTVSDYVVYQWDANGKYHQLEKQNNNGDRPGCAVLRAAAPRYLSLSVDLHSSALRGPLQRWSAVVGARAISIR